MADAGITVRIAADATAFRADFQRTMAEITAGNAELAASAKGKAAISLQAIENEIEANRLWKNSVNASQIAESEALLVKEQAIAAAKFSEEANKAEAAAKLKDAVATEADTAANTGLAGALARVLVILKDILRGQWNRALSSTATLFTELGASAGVLLAVAAGLAAILIPLYYVYEAAKKAAEGVTYLDDALGRMEIHLRDHISGVMELAKAEMDYARWKKKINDELDAAQSGTAETRLDQMRQEFEWRQKIAKLRGQTAVQGAQAEIDQKQAEQKFLTDEIGKASKAASDADLKKDAAEKGRGKNILDVQDRQKVAENALAHAIHAAAAVDTAFQAQMALSKTRVPFAATSVEGGGMGYAQGAATPTAGTVFNTPQGSFTQAQAHKYLADAQIEATRAAGELAGAQGHLTDVTEEAKEKNKEWAALLTKRLKTEQDLELLKKYALEAAGLEDQKKKEPGHHLSSAILTEAQRHGAFMGYSIVNVQDAMARDVHSILNHLTGRGSVGHHSTRGHHESNFGPSH